MNIPREFAKRSLLSARHLHLKFDEYLTSLTAVSNKPLLFNLDLHISVMRDLQQELDQANCRSIRWSISGSNRFYRRLYRVSDPVDVVNLQSWSNLNEEMITRFEERYSKFLGKFDGFIVTHTPAFSQLYRSFNKPILTINSTRYEAPYTDDLSNWRDLDDYIFSSIKNNRMHLVSNNQGDSDYLKYQSGIHSEVIPSFCDYTNLKWKPGGKKKVVVTRSPEIEKAIEKYSGGEWIGIRKVLGNNYKWKDYLGVGEILYIPYNISTMSLFEFATAGIPVVLPSKKFLKELCGEYGGILSELSYYQIRRLSTQGLMQDDPNNYQSDTFLDWWLDRADFYDLQLMPNVRIISDFQELNHVRFKTENSFNLFRQEIEVRNSKLDADRTRLIQNFTTMI